MDFPLSLYFDSEIANVQTLDLCRGEDDYRKIYITDDGQRKLVIKRLSNTFSDRHRIEGWFRLMEEYRKAGIYCPAVIPNRYGETLHCDTADGRDYYTYAEEFAIFETAEHIGEDKCKNERGQYCYTPDIMRLLGRIAAAGLDILDWPSAYCMLEPFCAPDTTDEATECAVAFVEYIRKHLPAHLSRAEALLALFYKRQDELRAIYGSLPTSCFQADLNESNILLDADNRFAGLIDFNLCGKEPILNYAVREALWGVSDRCLYGENDNCLYFYSKALDDIRIQSFLDNIRWIQETYTFTDTEREAFPVLFRYMNSFWWNHLAEIKQIREDEGKIKQLLNWLEQQMTRDDIRLP